MKYRHFLSLLAFYFTLSTVQADVSSTNQELQKIALPSCNVNVTADYVFYHSNGVTYSGNVEVLVGFARLKANKITLIKNKDGSCELVTQNKDL